MLPAILEAKSAVMSGDASAIYLFQAINLFPSCQEMLREMLL